MVDIIHERIMQGESCCLSCSNNGKEICKDCLYCVCKSIYKEFYIRDDNQYRKYLREKLDLKIKE